MDFDTVMAAVFFLGLAGLGFSWLCLKVIESKQPPSEQT